MSGQIESDHLVLADKRATKQPSSAGYMMPSMPFVTPIAVDDAIEAQCDQLMGFPESSRAGRIAGTRELVITGYPFIVVYRLSEDMGHFLRVIEHLSRLARHFLGLVGLCQ